MLHSQFTVVLHDILFFSVPSCNNLLLVLKMFFQIFSFASKKLKVIFSGRKMIIPQQLLLFHLQICVSNFKFFEILIFRQHIWGNIHYVHEINLNSSGTLIKAFYFPRKTNQKKSETTFVNERQLKTIIPK